MVRDIVADVAAAMLAAGNGRGQLSDVGWDALVAAVDSDTSVDQGGSTVIH